MRGLIASLLAFILVGSPTLAPAQTGDSLDGLRKALLSGSDVWKAEPVYHEKTGSYYQFVYDAGTDRGGSTGLRWAEAEGAARTFSFKGRQGRLAQLTDPNLYESILANWDLSTLGYGGRTWIGLRYWCPYRQLTWSTGEEHSFNAFGPWDTPWYRDKNTRCVNQRDMTYMGVYIEGATKRWRATGPLKRFPHFLVEYPAPRETAETSEAR